MRALALVCLAVLPAAAQDFDLVIRNGRVLDPETKLDAVRNLGIRGGKVQTISAAPLQGRGQIDATGLVVAPGFIDLHSHGQDDENYRAKAMDGVTTALELEVGVGDIDAWYAERAGRALIHHGATIGHIPARMAVMHDPGHFLPSGDAAHRAATDEEITALRRRIEVGLQRGAMGVGFGLGYTPAASRWEVLEMFRVAARFGATCFVHMRATGEDSVEALEEIIAASAITGAPLHAVHITSMGLRFTPKLLQIIAEARRRGLDVTTEMYPYTAAMTEIESALFDSGWQQKLGVGYGALQWVATGERLTADTFARYRKSGGTVIMHMIPAEVVDAAIADPLTMIASDGMLTRGKGHPRGSGSYARVLGHYVRDAHVLTLMDAVAKMSLEPARRLQARVPAMQAKGRIRAGADADLAIFDPAQVRDRSDYQHPAAYSEGFRYVLVDGVPVVREGHLVEGVFPGRGLHAPLGNK